MDPLSSVLTVLVLHCLPDLLLGGDRDAQVFPGPVSHQTLWNSEQRECTKLLFFLPLRFSMLLYLWGLDLSDSGEGRPRVSQAEAEVTLKDLSMNSRLMLPLLAQQRWPAIVSFSIPASRRVVGRNKSSINRPTLPRYCVVRSYERQCVIDRLFHAHEREDHSLLLSCAWLWGLCL